MRETRSPGGSGARRDRSGEPSERGERRAEGATFASARVARRRDRSPFAVIAFVVGIGGLVVAGLAGREEPAGGVPANPTPITSVVAGGSTPPPMAIYSQRPFPRQSPDRAPILTTGPGPIVLITRRHPETLFVHGDVFVEQVTWVFVNLQDAAGRVAGWTSVSVPGGAGPGAGDGATLRFDVELAIPGSFDSSLWLQAMAYDEEGTLVSSQRLEIPVDGAAAAGAVTDGFRPGFRFPLLDANAREER